MPRVNFLSECNYAHGYQQALQDVFSWFNKHSVSLTFNKMYNRQGVALILKCMADNADKMQELGDSIEFVVHDEQVGKKIVHKSIEVCKVDL